MSELAAGEHVNGFEFCWGPGLPESARDLVRLFAERYPDLWPPRRYWRVEWSDPINDERLPYKYHGLMGIADAGVLTIDEGLWYSFAPPLRERVWVHGAVLAQGLLNGYCKTDRDSLGLIVDLADGTFLGGHAAMSFIETIVSQVMDRFAPFGNGGPPCPRGTTVLPK